MFVKADSFQSGQEWDGSSHAYHRSTGPLTEDLTPETRSIGYALRYVGSSGKRA